MKRIRVLGMFVAAVVAAVASTVPTLGQDDGKAAPVFGIKIYPGYRDWKFVSVAHEEGNLHSIGAVLGNEVAIKAYREGKLPFPDGAVIVALHYKDVASDENNKVFGQVQSYVAGPPTNIQFMVKDSKKWPSTGGWGFAHFNHDGKPVDDAFMNTCYPCHAKASRDFVFTQYAP